MTRAGTVHPLVASCVALSASVLAGVAITLFAGPGKVWHVLSHLQPGWLLLGVLCEFVSLLSYAAAYRAVVLHFGQFRLTARLSVRLVVAGFGAFAVLGGFAVDRRALRLLGAERHEAELSVLALGLFELSVLAPAAWLAALVLLLDGSSVMGSMLWPWVLGVPVVLLVAGWVTWLTGPDKARRPRIVSDCITTIKRMLVSWSSLKAWLGLALYFAAEVAEMALCLRALGITIGLGPLLIAFSSGYLLTRRTLPFGGAGFVELLLTFSLHWVGLPLAPAFAAVVLYRAVDFLLLALLALMARAALSPTLRAAAMLEDQQLLMPADG